MAIKTLRVFQEFTSEGYVPMPPSGNIDYGYTIAGTFPEETPTTFQLDDPDLEVEVTEMTDFYVWIRSHGSEWNINYTRNVRVYPDSPLINNVVMGIIIANLDYTVPYVGATENVDLGEFGISGGFVHLDNTPTTANVPTTPGTLSWNDSDGTADLKLKGGNVTLQIGQEQVVRVVNKTGATLNEADFRAVRVRSVAEGGAQGQRLAVMLAQADSDADSATTIGLVTENILNNQEGFITTSGNINKVNTTGAKSYGGTETWVDGDVLYLSPTHPGYLTKVKPQAPDHTVIIGWVVYAHAVNGKIFVKVDNGYELDELHNVKINNPLLDDFLMYDTTLNVWKNKDLHGTKGYIPYYNDTTLFLNSPFWTNGSLVGLGTITPSALLHMKGTTAYTNVILDNNGATGGGMFSAYQNGSEVAMFGTDAYYQTNTSIDAAIVAKKVGGGIQFYTNGSQSEKMGINADGNVFVGQTPTYVAGATQLIVRGKTGAGYLGVNHYDMSIKGFMNTFNSVFQIGTSTFHSLAFLVENNERGRVNSSGRLLWGTTTDNGVDLVQINGSLVATSIKKQGGLSTEFLMADGSVSSGSTLTASLPLSITGGVISISQATNTSNGYLSSTDWVTFNAKQSALSGTGFVKVSGTTISYDNTAYTPTSRLLTINGTSYDLSADRSWTITPGSGMRNIQTFTATSGQTTFTITGGYTVGLVDVFVNGTRLSTSDFTATNGTSVVLGFGVVANDIVDVINYTASLTSGITGSGTNGYLPRWSSTSNLTNSIIFNSASGIGINTTTPRASLDVVGTIYSRDIWIQDNYSLLFGNLNTGASSTYIYGVGGDGVTNYLGFATNGSEKMRILANGNVGIGITNPSERLSVIGNIRIDNGAADGGQLVLASSGFSDWNIDNFSGSLRAYYGATEYLRLTSSGQLGIGTTTPDTYSQFGTGAGLTLQTSVTNGSSNINVVGNGTGFGGINFGNGTIRRAGIYGLDGSILGFYTNSTNSGSGLSERLRIDSSGNVGIGTTSPNRALVVRGGNQEQLVLISTTTKSGINLNPSDTTYSPYIGATGNSIITETSGSTRLQITSTGRVIQYSDGFVVASGASNTVAGGSFLAVANAAQDNWVLQQLNASFGLDWWTYSVSAGWNRRMTFTQSGNLGIGTTAPGARLEVANSSDLIFNLTRASVGTWGFNVTSAGHLFLTNRFGSNVFQISDSGAVGIGTTNPTEIFNVYSAQIKWLINLQHGNGTQFFLNFMNPSGGQVGSVMGNGTTTSYNVTSDYRLKEDLKPINGLDKVSKINVYDFKWKNSDDRMDGVIAHELQEILPYAVFGEKDGKQIQQVDYSKIVPVLVQAIKELNAKLEAK